MFEPRVNHFCAHLLPFTMDWMGWDGTGWDGMGWDGMGGMHACMHACMHAWTDGLMDRRSDGCPLQLYFSPQLLPGSRQKVIMITNDISDSNRIHCSNSTSSTSNHSHNINSSNSLSMAFARKPSVSGPERCLNSY